ncbi:MAG: hypothetical protein QOE69_3320, partial [Thermoleophilaceae bacterium]|nr:hypothetical protein [Thermoleophilaceae bacterium]
ARAPPRGARTRAADRLAHLDGNVGPPARAAVHEPAVAVDPDQLLARGVPDGAVDPRGRFWAGTMSLAGDTRTAALYRLDPDLTVTCALPGLSVSNGLGWSPDGSTLYHVDSPRRRIDLYEFELEAGRVAGRRAVMPVPREHGTPDGLTVDADGGVWVAMWGGGAVHRYAAAGELEERLELPVTNVTSCCFGDADLSTLYVTTAARGAAHEPLAGALFALRPGVRGLPATPFAG